MTLVSVSVTSLSAKNMAS